MEEVAKKEPEESPTLRISDVQTVKTEEPESSVNFRGISVRTPTSINNGTSSVGPSGKVLVKRLGSTTIRSVPATNMKQAAKAQLVKMANGNYQTHPAYTTPRIPMHSPQAPLPKPVTTLYRAPTDPRDDIIRQLQEQNREMKKMLLECRREASQIQTKMRRWTVAINEVLGRVQRLQAPGTIKAVPQKPTVVPQLPPPIPPALSPTTTRNGPVMKVTARKSTSLPPPQPLTAADVVFRSPAFPIKSFSSLKTFEGDLKNRDFFEFVGQKLMATISKFKIEKPATLLAYVLQTLVNPSLLSSMVWDHQESSQHESSQRLALVNFRRLRELYSRLVNNMSKNLYGKNLDPAAVERFLRSKLFSDLKLRHHNAMIQQQQLAQRQAAASLELRKAMHEAEKKIALNSTQEHEDDTDDIEWIDDKVGESCDLGNEILGDDSEQKPEESENNETVDHEEEENGKEHPESTVEENEFHFMDC